MAIAIQYLIFVTFGMFIQYFNILSAFVISYKLNIEMLQVEVVCIQFPHLLAPIAYSVAIVIYLSNKLLFWL